MSTLWPYELEGDRELADSDCAEDEGEESTEDTDYEEEDETEEEDEDYEGEDMAMSFAILLERAMTDVGRSVSSATRLNSVIDGIAGALGGMAITFVVITHVYPQLASAFYWNRNDETQCVRGPEVLSPCVLPTPVVTTPPTPITPRPLLGPPAPGSTFPIVPSPVPTPPALPPVR